VVSGFGPGVRAEEVEARDGCRGEEVFDGVLAFESEDFGIGESESVDVFAGAADATEESFDAEEVAFRVVFCHFDEE